MALSPADERKVMQGLIRWWGNLPDDLKQDVVFTKPNMAAAITAMDNFFEANAAAINSAFPQPFRGAATTEQKTLLFAVVALARFNPGLLRYIFGV